MERDRSQELIVGIVVLLGLAILTYFITRISNFRPEPRYPLRIIFGFVGGVTEGRPVGYCGVQAGEVKSVRTFFDPEEKRPKVELLVRIKKDLKIQEDAHAYIASFGLLGEKYVEILPGSAGARILKEDEVLVGHDIPPIEWMAQQGEEIINKLNKTIDSLNATIGDKDNQARFKQTLANLEELTGNLNCLTTDLRSLVSENKDKVGESMDNIKTLSEDIDVALDSINNILARVEKGEGTLGKLLQDEKIYNDLEELVSDVKRHPWKLLFKTKDKAKERVREKEEGKEEETMTEKPKPDREDSTSRTPKIPSRRRMRFP